MDSLLPVQRTLEGRLDDLGAEVEPYGGHFPFLSKARNRIVPLPYHRSPRKRRPETGAGAVWREIYQLFRAKPLYARPGLQEAGDHNPGVGGSSPSPATKKSTRYPRLGSRRVRPATLREL